MWSLTFALHGGYLTSVPPWMCPLRRLPVACNLRPFLPSISSHPSIHVAGRAASCRLLISFTCQALSAFHSTISYPCVHLSRWRFNCIDSPSTLPTSKLCTSFVAGANLTSHSHLPTPLKFYPMQ
ncbi:hypothetical protein SCLCIDRAFT_683058 [Scleroderma citrinum Foug A]|uniref:Uncharacterized protein n=1 Tax=Scleroderma citrinum Foug A TaxID=1036808 RepID=A0A0C3CRC7_9AGAM|nr:hypothetical protein SCLCIDRAFT_683058 [Scleroderma citrinum Foug A]